MRQVAGPIGLKMSSSPEPSPSPGWTSCIHRALLEFWGAELGDQNQAEKLSQNPAFRENREKEDEANTQYSGEWGGKLP